MSKFIEAIKVYKKYGFDIKTGLNPSHFCGQGALYFPFTYVFESNTIKELVTGDFSC